MSESEIPNSESIVVGGGCFWCTEAAYRMVPGVLSVESGYAVGDDPAPTYEKICGGQTGHAEVVRVTYDPTQVELARILALFWKMHDPTTLNRQGADTGTQYRSIILWADEAQRVAAAASRAEADAAWGGKVVTELAELTTFYPAEVYHDDYFARNPQAGYCQMVIAPKLDKFRREI
ncbi:peptide-methionine (S)-S-oxide reductase MsrA [Synoicihabitans lomoniglobus]|uniref:Peptide methionine sulfoxide reductase MsrA n=1 Tax=Synoicihabitans lomoniglobus TaxID=2909285 RepID=A0AAE9ZXU8_9BACT|nr:peptide-methionine (S)-S-oxide reductase MsrA [Opitutaceae bacterium LMO-M01]WED65561.1 peptide-methionine (S)-S-oxide reductase MsrA [Opitutaceae bacterium LMO-M01]